MRIHLCDLLAQGLGPGGMKNRTGEFYGGRGRRTGVSRPTESASITSTVLGLSLRKVWSGPGPMHLK